MKRTICALLALLLLMSLLPTAIFSEPLPYEGKTVILATGNLRGNIDVYPQVKALKDSYKEQGADVILVDTGNFLQGSTCANSDRGLSVYNLMDACGYDVANLGLAEFSYADATTGYPYHGNFHRYYTQKMLQDGTDEITYNVKSDGSVTATLHAKEPASFQAICSGYFDEKGFYSFEPAAEVITGHGLKLLFLSDTDENLHQYLPDGVLGDESLVIETEGYDLVVTLSNAEKLPQGEPDGLVIHAGDAKLLDAYVIDNELREVVAAEEFFSQSEDPAADVPKLAYDEALAAAVEQIKTDALPVLFTSELTMEGRDSVSRAKETNLGDLVTDALKWYAENYIDGWNKELPLVALQNGGNLDNFLYPGDVTETDLLRSLPFSPMGVGVLELTGAQLLEVLEAGTSPSESYGEAVCPGFAQVSGLSYVIKRYEDYDGGEAYGKFYRADSIRRVEIEDVGGKGFDPDATYAIVADNYILNGNDTYYVCKEAKEAGAAYVNNGGGVKTRDIVALYVKSECENVLADEQQYAAPEGRITNLWAAPLPVKPFEDVEEGTYFYDAVLWAVYHEPQITNGTDDTHFAPGSDCTRGQVVTFLWRAHGCEEPASNENPFEDVEKGKFYYQAVLWAVENGITKGVDDTHFGPGNTCTRGQVVTFLWRAGGSAEPIATECAFEDVDSDAFYYHAMLWAVANGITKGTGDTTFAPGSVCTRGQVVTFLYRAASVAA